MNKTQDNCPHLLVATLMFACLFIMLVSPNLNAQTKGALNTEGQMASIDTARKPVATKPTTMHLESCCKIMCKTIYPGSEHDYTNCLSICDEKTCVSR